MADFDGFVRDELGYEPPSPLPASVWQRLSAVPALYRQLRPLDGARAFFQRLTQMAAGWNRAGEATAEFGELELEILQDVEEVAPHA